MSQGVPPACVSGAPNAALFLTGGVPRLSAGVRGRRQGQALRCPPAVPGSLVVLFDRLPSCCVLAITWKHCLGILIREGIPLVLKGQLYASERYVRGVRRRAARLCGGCRLHRYGGGAFRRHRFKRHRRHVRRRVRPRSRARRHASRPLFHGAFPGRCARAGGQPGHRDARRVHLRAVRGVRGGAAPLGLRQACGHSLREHAGALPHRGAHGAFQRQRLDAGEHGQPQRVHDGLLHSLRRHGRRVRAHRRPVQDRRVRRCALAQRARRARRAGTAHPRARAGQAAQRRACARPGGREVHGHRLPHARPHAHRAFRARR